VISMIKNKMRKLRVYYEKQGLWGLFRHIVTNLVNYNKWAIFEGDITENHDIIEAKIPVIIRLATTSDRDINSLAEFWPDTYTPPFSTPQSVRELIAGLLTAGEKCMIAEYEGKIVHMNWMGFHDTHEYNSYETKRKLEPDEAISYYTYCAVEYRGNNLMGAVRTTLFSFLAENNYKKIISYVIPANTPSVKVNTRFSGKQPRILRTWKILGLNFNFLSRERT